MYGIPPALEPASPQIGLLTHREQKRADGVPGGCRQPALNPADGGLRGAGAYRE
jgi:hypothetical protein